MSGKITAIEAQKRNKERVNIYIDDEFAFGLNIMDAAALYKGKVMSSEEIHALKARDEVAQALDRAIRFLASRPRSIAEIRRRLAEKGVDDVVIDQVILKLEHLKYVDDLEFARFWVRNREEFNPRGQRALRYELQQKGIENDIIESVLAELDSQDSAYRAAEKKIRSLRGKDEDTVRQKLMGFLGRRGFSYDDIRTAVNQVIDDMHDNNEFDNYHNDQ